ncbi:MAG: hypothetical protein HC892_05030 [Saprospiraceae bacterium]|nr:hypothetical protein [Saprospiraceae bacterium]
MKGNVAYFSLFSYLVENTQRIYYAQGYDNSNQSIDFLSFKDYIERIQVPKRKGNYFLYF